MKLLPSAEAKLAILKLAVETLTKNDRFRYIGMDHFASPTDELAVAQSKGTLQRNFQGYSARAGSDIFAMGMSAISQTAGAYWQNTKRLPEYYAALDAGNSPLAKACILSPDDRIRRHVIMRLMCDLRLEFNNLSQFLGVDFPAAFTAELQSLQELEDDGLLTCNDRCLAVTDTGRLFLRNIAMRFDRYLNSGAPSPQQFSKTV